MNSIFADKAPGRILSFTTGWQNFRSCEPADDERANSSGFGQIGISAIVWRRVRSAGGVLDLTNAHSSRC